MLTRRELLAAITGAAVLSFDGVETQTMEQRISLVTLGVKNLAASKQFYVDGLGWKPGYEDKEIIFFQTGGMVFALFLREKLAEDFRTDPAKFGVAPMALAHNVRAKNEVDPIIQRAVAAGAKLLKPAREAPWGGYSGYFADPDGFAWEIAWNPSWHIRPDGTIEFH
jgi:uncharacterized protein